MTGKLPRDTVCITEAKTAATMEKVSVAIPLAARDPDRNPLTLRVVSQPTHGTAGPPPEP